MERTIEACTTIRAAQARVHEVLVDDPAAAFGDFITREQRRAREFPVDLQVDIGAGTSVHQAVLLRLGPARSVDDGIAIPITWHSSGRERLYPTFAGELEALHDRAGTLLRVSGTYTVPMGAIGRFGDGVLGRRLARRALDALVQHVAPRLDAEVARRAGSVALRPAVYPVSLRETDVDGSRRR